jgi:predicted ribosomally synthesized peptide with SipW-like signal peptide
MTDDRLTLSRRKLLAATGAVGAASTGLGLTTSAYFSDRETFQNDRLVAGQLDMRVGFEERYSNWPSTSRRRRRPTSHRE